MYSPQEVAERVTELARQHKISINKLLLENGLGKSAIDNMKAGRMPSADRLAIIARALGTDSYYLLGMGAPESLCISDDITSSNVVQGTNQGTLTVRNGNERSISDEEVELLRIYNSLDVRTRHQLMAATFEFEKKNLFNEGDISMNNRTNKLGEYIKTLRGDMNYNEFIERVGRSLTPSAWETKDYGEQGLDKFFVETLEGDSAVKRITITEDILKRFLEDAMEGFKNQDVKIKGYSEVAALAEESGWVFAAYSDAEVNQIFKQIGAIPEQELSAEASSSIKILKEHRKLTQYNYKYKPTARAILKLAEETKKQPEYFTGIKGDISNEISGNISNSSLGKEILYSLADNTDGNKNIKDGVNIMSKQESENGDFTSEFPKVASEQLAQLITDSKPTTYVDRIFNLMKRRRISDTQFSEKIRVSKETIDSWRKKLSKPNIDQLPLIADYLNVSNDYLLCGGSVGIHPIAIVTYETLSQEQEVNAGDVTIQLGLEDLEVLNVFKPLGASARWTWLNMIPQGNAYKLIGLFEQLNSEGQEAAIKYTEYLSVDGKYKKPDTTETEVKAKA
jgi:transcriptional regulator with XRE-family HTH domain